MARAKKYHEQGSLNFQELYLHDLNLYNYPPHGEITLEELKELSTQRLNVLKLVEEVYINNRKKSVLYFKNLLTDMLQKSHLDDYVRLLNAPGCRSHINLDHYVRRRDHVSHFILRAAVSFDLEKRQWFYRQEVRLFKWRLSSLDRDGIITFNFINGFNYTVISQDEKEKIHENLSVCFPKISDISDTGFYKVHFSMVRNLVKRRKVFMKHGMAFIPETDITSIFLTHFKKNLIANFENARATVANIADDGRLTYMFKQLSDSIHITDNMRKVAKPITVDALNELSKLSYPLCMRVLHEALRANHHLTNGGRVQYSLFLKGIGLSLDDTMELWRNEFMQKMNTEIFEKKYSYNLRHLFGQEGKRADYEPFSCSKIMRSVIGHRDNHGCPFKYLQANRLSRKLADYGLVHADIQTLVELSKDRKYLLACNKYFQIKHNCITNYTYVHPNTYFKKSQELLSNDIESETDPECDE